MALPIALYVRSPSCLTGEQGHEVRQKASGGGRCRAFGRRADAPHERQIPVHPAICVSSIIKGCAETCRHDDGGQACCGHPRTRTRGARSTAGVRLKASPAPKFAPGESLLQTSRPKKESNDIPRAGGLDQMAGCACRAEGDRYRGRGRGVGGMRGKLEPNARQTRGKKHWTQKTGGPAAWTGRAPPDG